LVSWLEEIERKLRETPVRRLRERDAATLATALVPLYVASGQLWVLLLKRTGPSPFLESLYAFPGGVVESCDGDEVDAALRGAGAELGIDPGVIILLGHLDEILTAEGFLVSPVVGALPHPIAVSPAPDQVEVILRVPFFELANPTFVEMQEPSQSGGSELSPVLHYHGHRVTGVTAQVIADVVRRLTGSSPVAVE
jgi:8-oxo-dGTP pyrophosphatase MutT (NUDIX family)